MLPILIQELILLSNFPLGRHHRFHLASIHCDVCAPILNKLRKKQQASTFFFFFFFCYSGCVSLFCSFGYLRKKLLGGRMLCVLARPSVSPSSSSPSTF